jgi:hypothetical protein
MVELIFKYVKNKKKKVAPPPPITIGPFSPRIAKIFQDELNKEKNGKSK